MFLLQTPSSTSPSSDTSTTTPSPKRDARLYILAFFTFITTSMVGGAVAALLTTTSLSRSAMLRISPTSAPAKSQPDYAEELAAFNTHLNAQANLLKSSKFISTAMQSSNWKSNPDTTDITPDQFLAALTVNRHTNEEFIQITFNHPNPDIADAAVSTILTTYQSKQAADSAWQITTNTDPGIPSQTNQQQRAQNIVLTAVASGLTSILILTAIIAIRRNKPQSPTLST